MPVLSSLPRAVRRAALAGTAALALVIAPAAAASAHVRVVPETTAAGGWTALTFRVPTESDTASTTALSVDLPTDTPFLHVSVRPVPGWTAQVQHGDLPSPVDVDGTTVTQAPLHVVWTATTDDAAIAPGQFQEFEISAGPLPAEGTVLVLAATQTYSDGTVVAWDEVADGDDEPEHPAPQLVVTAGDGDDHHAQDPAPDAGTDVDPLARTLGGVGAALGAVALLVALLGRRRPAGRTEA